MAARAYMQRPLLIDSKFQEQCHQKNEKHETRYRMDIQVHLEDFFLINKYKDTEVQQIIQQAIECVLEYCTTTAVIIESFTLDTLQALYTAATLFGVETLVQRCEEWQLSLLDGPTVVLVLRSHICMQNQSLKKLCLGYIDMHASTVFSCKEFEDLPIDIVAEIISRTTLTADELSVFEVVVRWGKSQIRHIVESQGSQNCFSNIKKNNILYSTSTSLSDDDVRNDDVLNIKQCNTNTHGLSLSNNNTNSKYQRRISNLTHIRSRSININPIKLLDKDEESSSGNDTIIQDIKRKRSRYDTMSYTPTLLDKKDINSNNNNNDNNTVITTTTPTTITPTTGMTTSSSSIDSDTNGTAAIGTIGTTSDNNNDVNENNTNTNDNGIHYNSNTGVLSQQITPSSVNNEDTDVFIRSQSSILDKEDIDINKNNTWNNCEFIDPSLGITVQPPLSSYNDKKNLYNNDKYLQLDKQILQQLESSKKQSHNTLSKESQSKMNLSISNKFQTPQTNSIHYQNSDHTHGSIIILQDDTKIPTISYQPTIIKRVEIYCYTPYLDRQYTDELNELLREKTKSYHILHSSNNSMIITSSSSDTKETSIPLLRTVYNASRSFLFPNGESLDTSAIDTNTDINVDTTNTVTTCTTSNNNKSQSKDINSYLSSYYYDNIEFIVKPTSKSNELRIGAEQEMGPKYKVPQSSVLTNGYLKNGSTKISMINLPYTKNIIDKNIIDNKNDIEKDNTMIYVCEDEKTIVQKSQGSEQLSEKQLLRAILAPLFKWVRFPIIPTEALLKRVQPSELVDPTVQQYALGSRLSDIAELYFPTYMFVPRILRFTFDTDQAIEEEWVFPNNGLEFHNYTPHEGSCTTKQGIVRQRKDHRCIEFTVRLGFSPAHIGQNKGFFGIGVIKTPLDRYREGITSKSRGILYYSNGWISSFGNTIDKTGKYPSFDANDTVGIRILLEENKLYFKCNGKIAGDPLRIDIAHFPEGQPIYPVVRLKTFSTCTILE